MIEVNIDASSLKSSNCMLDFWRTIHKGYRHKVNGASLVYGSAVHKFIETMYSSGGNLGTARDAMKEVFNVPKVDSPKQPWLSDYKHCLNTCISYWEQYIKEDGSYEVILLPNDEPAVEVTFNFQYYVGQYVTVNLVGTMDKVGKIKGGVYAIGDYKTTTSWNVEQYFKQYERSIQLMFYIMALKWMGDTHPDSVLGQIGKTRLGAFIDGIFLNASPASNTYKRSQIFTPSEDQLLMVKKMLDYKIQELDFWAGKIERGEESAPPQQGLLHGTCEKKWGLCTFWNVCNAGAQGDILLNRDFVQVPYNPLKFNEVHKQIAEMHK